MGFKPCFVWGLDSTTVVSLLRTVCGLTYSPFRIMLLGIKNDNPFDQIFNLFSFINLASFQK